MADQLLRSLASRLSPASRRWRAFLTTLDLDLDLLPQHLPEPGDNDFIICGSPRTGTTLVAAMLFQPPGAVTVMEPWDGLRVPPAELFASLRAELTGGTLSRGKLDIAALVENGDVEWTSEGTAVPVPPLTDDFLLGVKWPAFWRYLDRLESTKFLVCLRHPFEVIGSYRKAGGRLARGHEYDVVFHRELNKELARATGDPLVRQVLLHDYVTERIVPHLQRPNVFAVRYERWFTDPDALLAEISDFLGPDLTRPLARLRATPPRHGLEEQDVERVRDLCRTAQSLGYDLHDPSMAGP